MLPTSADDLISLLDAENPARPPALTDSERMIWFKAGRRSLVDDLLVRRAQTDDNVLADSLIPPN